MYSSGLSSRSRTAPGSTSETATAKLPPRVIQVRDFPASTTCGAILANSALEAGRGRTSGMGKLLGCAGRAARRLCRHDRRVAPRAPRYRGRVSASETGRGGRPGPAGATVLGCIERAGQRPPQEGPPHERSRTPGPATRHRGAGRIDAQAERPGTLPDQLAPRADRPRPSLLSAGRVGVPRARRAARGQQAADRLGDGIYEETGFPKSTIVRMLETLCAEGYVARDNMCGGYRVTSPRAASSTPATRASRGRSRWRGRSRST